MFFLSRAYILKAGVAGEAGVQTSQNFLQKDFWERKNYQSKYYSVSTQKQTILQRVTNI